MTARIWLLLAVLVLGFADVTRATDMLKAKFHCDGLVGSQISVTVKIEDVTQATTVKWKGKNLGANAGVFCGYDCVYFGNTTVQGCSSADATGKWKQVDENPTPQPCAGLLPRVQVLPGNNPCYQFLNP